MLLKLYFLHVLDGRYLYHVTNNDRILTVIHAYGLMDDLHQCVANIEQLPQSIVLSKESQCGGGSISHSLTDANDYLKTNFVEERVIVFPIMHPDPLDAFNTLVDNFQKVILCFL